MSKMMRISDKTAESLNGLAKEIGQSKQSILEKALDYYAREIFLKGANEDISRFKKNDPKGYAEYVQESNRMF